MSSFPPPLDTSRIKVYPVASRRSQSEIEEIIVLADKEPAPVPPETDRQIKEAVARVKAARQAGAGVMLIYGAHLIKNGGADLLIHLVKNGWITHLATNGAGGIHDWEFAFLGRSTEGVEQNVATGTFGTWDETSRYTHLAILAGALSNEGYGRSLGRFIFEEGVNLPTVEALENQIRSEPSHPLTAARAELAQAMRIHGIPAGTMRVAHLWKHRSVLGQAFGCGVPLTVHPGIGYDIISNHPMFNGAALGRAAGLDFRQFGAAVESLDRGVAFSVGSAIMGPQVFEKSLSCVNNLRLQAGRPIVHDHSIFVVDLQDGGNWDWTRGEPPRENPAYYLRFCKSYSRMGGAMHYCCCDNILFLHNLWHHLKSA